MTRSSSDVNSLFISFEGQDGSIKVDNYFLGKKVELIRIVNGETIENIDISNIELPVIGTIGDDVINLQDTLTDQVVFGLEGGDIITGGWGNDTLNGDEGNDTIRGGRLNDTILGGAGDDDLDGGREDDFLEGGAGNDVIKGSLGSDVLSGGADDDILTGGEDAGDSYLFGNGDGHDIIKETTGNVLGIGVDIIEFKAGVKPEDVTLVRNSADLVLSLNNGNDTITLSNQYLSLSNYLSNRIEEVHFEDGTVWDLINDPAFHNLPVIGTENDDVLNGGSDDEEFMGLGGNDNLTAYAGDDTLNGGLGDDYLSGGLGNDTYIYNIGDGNDLIFDGLNEGSDVIEIIGNITSSDLIFSTPITNLFSLLITFEGQEGSIQIHNFFYSGVEKAEVELIRIINGEDVEEVDMSNVSDVPIIGTSGSETIRIDGYHSDRTIYGLEGNDRIYAVRSSGDLTISGGEGNDNVSGDSGSDTLFGDDGDDRLQGNEGNDSAFGGSGNDIIYGGGGDDTLVGGTGDDRVSGQEGNDTYIFNKGDGNDIINNFDSSGLDFDILELGEGLLLENTVLTRSHIYGGLVISFTDSPEDSITVESYYDSVAARIDEVHFADGSILQVDGNPDFENLPIVINGTEAVDYLNGSNSGEFINGFGGDDYIFALDGNDTINGGLGNDYYGGGSGNDIFIITPDAGSIDTISDFESSNPNEFIDLTAFKTIFSLDDVILSYDGWAVTISLPDNQIITLENHVVADISNDNFKFFEIPNVAPTALDIAANTNEDISFVISAADLLDQSAAADIDGGSLTIFGVSNALNGTAIFDGTDATFTPTADYNGPASFEFTIDDGNGGTVTQTVNLSIISINDKPVVSVVNGAVDEDSTVIITLPDATDAEDVMIAPTQSNVTLYSITAGASVIVDTDGTIIYQAPTNFNGADSFSYTITDSEGLESEQKVVSVTVNPTNDAPTASNVAGSSDEDSSFVVSAADLIGQSAAVDIDGDSLTVSGVSNALNGTASFDGTDVIFTPAADYNGPASFEFTIDDGNSGELTKTVNLTIDAVNDIPVATLVNVTTNEDESVLIALPDATDVEDGIIAATQVNVILSNITAGASAVVNADGTISYQGSADFFGQDSFDYTITDSEGGVSSAQTVTVDVTSVNDAPVAVLDDSITTDEDTAITIDVLANDTDGDSAIDPTSVIITTQPTNGTLSVNAVTGIVTYTPAVNYNGPDSFQYTVADVEGAASNPALVEINVSPVNDAPVLDISLLDQNATEGADFDFIIPADSFSDIDGDALTYTATLADDSALPAWLTFDGTSFTGNPAVGDVGQIEVTVVASDGLAKAEQNFTLTIDSGTPVENVITGTNSNETLIGTSLLDRIEGLGGNDILKGKSGDDILNGGSGKDKLYGGIGADEINGGGGKDTAYYNDSTEAVTVNLNTNVNIGGTAQGDILTSVEKIIGSKYNDNITGNNGNNTLKGGSGNDIITGANGNDKLLGGSGNDKLYGGNNNDTLKGGGGSDILHSGNGKDNLFGGSGSDSFMFKTITDSNSVGGIDTIKDFADGVDLIDLSGLTSNGDISGFSDLTITNNGTNTTVEANVADFEIILSGVHALDNADFVF